MAKQISAILVLLLVSAVTTPALTAGPRGSDSNNRPEKSQPMGNPSNPGPYRPDATAKCGTDFCRCLSCFPAGQF
jgi:hypothetical protein